MRLMLTPAMAARPGLDYAAASQRRRRTLGAEHKRLTVNGDDRLGDEELCELGYRRGCSGSSPAAKARPKPRLSPGVACSGRGAASGRTASFDPATSTVRTRVASR